MRVAKECWPFFWGVLAGFALLGWVGKALGYPDAAVTLWAVGVGGAAFMLFFFRDPDRTPPSDPAAFVSGADGVVRRVEVMPEDTFLKTETVRVSVFLSVFNVHVNRSPLAGQVIDLRYTPGKKLFAFLDAASEYNEHTSVLIHGDRTRCLVRQIVGPVARRVVCWLRPGETVGRGGRLGIMKFGSRMDVFFPQSEVTVQVTKGDRVVAGETVIATLKGDTDL
jgi:phosphatidylserine decarboxylase